MVKPKEKTTRKSHILIFGTVFIIILSVIISQIAESVTLEPDNIIIHTNLVYYDGHFSKKTIVEDLSTALYVLNQSDENIYANIYEYDKSHKETKTFLQIKAWENKYIKTDGPGVVYLSNSEGTSDSIVKFSRWASFKKYVLPSGFSL